MDFVIFLVASFFAVNMGASSFAAAFAAAHGGNLLHRRTAVFLFIAFVILGALIMGDPVSSTLGRGIIAPTLFDNRVLIIIFLVGGLSMFIGNMIMIPQSTSLVTVAAIAGVGQAIQSVQYSKIFYCLFFWLVLPLLSFILTRFITGYIYPPRQKNFWVYEKFVNQKEKLKLFSILAGCYCAFSVGANNVSNILGPLTQGRSTLTAVVLLFALIYASGSLFFNGSVRMIGSNVVPLGILTVSIISLVSGSLMLIASYFGVPQSFVMLQMGSLFAVSVLKNGGEETWGNPITQRTFYSWIINPIFAFIMSFILSKLILQ
jgi:sulfate permease